MPTLILSFLILVLSSSAYAWNSPREAIEQFLSFELNGGRLDGSNWKTYTTKYIAAPENYEEPGWDEVTVVKSSQILGIHCAPRQHCFAKVSFLLYPTGEFNDPNVVQHRNGGNVVLSYNLVKKGGGWFVAPELGSPIVLEAVYRKQSNKK